MNSTAEMTGLTDIGRRRQVNQDTFYVDSDAGVMIVSDGMGGHRAGEVASRIIVEALPVQIVAAQSAGCLVSPTAGAELMSKAIDMVGRLIYEKGCSHARLAGMGATVVTGLVVGNSLVIAHLGDSRAYLLRQGREFFRLTEDHNIAEFLVAVGEITPEESNTHPGQCSLLRFAGMQDCPPPDVGIVEVCPGDRVLLCSDGLTAMLDDETIADTMAEMEDASELCSRLVDLANGAGGNDNITVVVADFSSDGDSETLRGQPVKVRRDVGRIIHRPFLGGGARGTLPGFCAREQRQSARGRRTTASDVGASEDEGGKTTPRND